MIENILIFTALFLSPFLLIGLFALMGTLSALAGDSFPDKSINQWFHKKLGRTWGGKAPELLIAAILASFGVLVWYLIIEHIANKDINNFWYLLMWVVFFAISLGGKESGTHAYLRHEGAKNDNNGDGVTDNKDLRKGTTSKWNMWLASRFGFQYGDEGFSWVWGFTKGLMTTAHLFGLGMIYQPLWREIMSHAKGRLPGDSNYYMENGDGFAYASTIITAVGTVLFFIMRG